MSSGIIVALDITNDLSSQMKEHIKIGDFSGIGRIILNQLCDEYPEHPVLAIHTYDGIRGMWHAIHEGSSMTVVADYDIESHESCGILLKLKQGNM
jgi:hypothetical protein